MKKNNSINISWLGVLGIAALCLLSRLPQLTSPYLHADYNGDECVMGLMARHMLWAQEFPFYFWGQSYGFSTIEAGAVALAIKFFGVGVLSLKVPMLLLWTLGCMFFYCALARWTSCVYSFWITCLLVFSPSWMAWSMKARGGYITAFLLTSIVLYLLACNSLSMKKRVCLFIGVLSGFVFFSQPVFLLGILPLLAYTIYSQKNLKGIFVCILGFIGVFLLGKAMVHIQGNTDFWKPAWFRPDPFSVFISSFKERVFAVLNQDANTVSLGKNLASVIISNAWCAVLLAGLIVHIFQLIIKKAGTLSTVFLTGVVLILGCTYFVNCEDQWRYLLSLSVFLILWFGVQSFEWMNRNIFLKVFFGLLISVFIVLGIKVAWNYKDFYRWGPPASKEIPEMQKISQVIKLLKASGVKYVFSLDDDLSWKITFFSHEQIISRWSSIRYRQPAYPQAVDQAFLKGERVAVVGNIIDEAAAYWVIAREGMPELVADPYFVYINPSKRLIIDELGFHFYRSPK